MSEIEAYAKYNIELATDELEKSGEISNYARCLIDSANHFKKNSEAMSEIIRLKEEENKQLAEDKAELAELVKSAYIEGCHDGYSEGLSDGQNWSSSKNNLEPDESWEISNSKSLLENTNETNQSA